MLSKEMKSQYQSSDHLFFFPLQEKLFLIPLADVQSMRTIRPKKRGKMPAVSINYGSPARPIKVTIHLKQVMTYSFYFIFILYKTSYNFSINHMDSHRESTVLDENFGTPEY